MRSIILATVMALSFIPSVVSAAPAETQIRATFEQFVTAQNAHDVKAVEHLLLDSPSLLWITRGNAIWGRSAALQKFEELYKGTWHLEPDSSSLKITMLSKESAQIFVPITFTIGAEGTSAIETRFLMNMILRRDRKTWRISAILPIPAAPAASK